MRCASLCSGRADRRLGRLGGSCLLAAALGCSPDAARDDTSTGGAASGGRTAEGGGPALDGGFTPSAGAGGASGGAEAICTDCDGACETAVALEAPAHIDGDLDYAEDPPAGGPHNGCWADWGVHTEPVRPENWVHNLEHGGIVFLYDCPDGCADDVAALEDLVEGRSQALLSPQPDMTPRFAAVAWGHRLSASCLDAAAFDRFYTSHVDQGPESVTSGAPAGCP